MGSKKTKSDRIPLNTPEELCAAIERMEKYNERRIQGPTPDFPRNESGQP